MKRISIIMLFVCVASLSGAMQIFAAQKISDKEILSKVKNYDGYTREVRRHLHFYPEVGGHEVETVKYLRNALPRLVVSKYTTCQAVQDSTLFLTLTDLARQSD